MTFGTLFAAEIPSVGTCGLPWAFRLKLRSLLLLAVLAVLLRDDLGDDHDRSVAITLIADGISFTVLCPLTTVLLWFCDDFRGV